MSSLIQAPIGVTSFRHHMSEVLKTARKEPVLLVERSNYQYVLLDLNRYNALVRREHQVLPGENVRRKQAFFEKLKAHGPITLKVKKTRLSPPITW